MKTASALFDRFQDANNAVRDLLNSGFTKDEVSLVSSNREKSYDNYFDNEGRYRNDSSNYGNATSTLSGSPVSGGSVIASDIDARTREMSGSSLNDKDVDDVTKDLTTGEGAATGAGIGAALGGLGGALMGLGLLVIPGVGPALAAGALASGLVGAGIGGAAGGIAGALANAGVSEEDADYFAEGVRRGGHLVVVSTVEDKYMTAQEILQRHNPASMRDRADTWRREGWTRFDPNASPYDPDRPASSMDDLNRADSNRVVR
ncbi:MAG: hypothetical protein ACRCYY_19415 [Trueperaceae bacterium]